MSHVLDIQHVTKLYGTVIGVNDISLSLGAGAYGLLGPNGSGKSTLLHLITGQLRPTLGSLRVLGHRPWGSGELLRHVGVCPEVDILRQNLSALAWVTYLLQLHGYAHREAQQRAEAALGRVGLQSAMRRAMGGYSRGMRQRAKLAQALAHDPQLLILDEPFSGLDPLARRSMTRLLRGWIDSGRSLILASHVLHEVEAITDTFLLISGGRLLASGSAAEVRSLLAHLPSEVRIRCSDPHRLARRVIEAEQIRSLRVEDADTLVISTASAAALYQSLPGWIAGTGTHVTELQSSDESLQTLFRCLMRIHRGEGDRGGGA